MHKGLLKQKFRKQKLLEIQKKFDALQKIPDGIWFVSQTIGHMKEYAWGGLSFEKYMEGRQEAIFIRAAGSLK